MGNTNTKYYTLCTRDADGVWSPQFGDYDRSMVREEQTHYRESYGYRYADLRIVETPSDRQQDINAAIDSLNHNIKSQFHGFHPA